MKVGNYNNRFTTQSFGVKTNINAQQIKKIQRNINIAPRIINQTTNMIHQNASQTHSNQNPAAQSQTSQQQNVQLRPMQTQILQDQNIIYSTAQNQASNQQHNTPYQPMVTQILSDEILYPTAQNQTSQQDQNVQLRPMQNQILQDQNTIYSAAQNQASQQQHRTPYQLMLTQLLQNQTSQQRQNVQNQTSQNPFISNLQFSSHGKILSQRKSIQEQISNNRWQMIQKRCKHNSEFTENNRIKNSNIIFLTNFDEYLKRINNTEFKGIKNYVESILKANKALCSQIKSYNLLHSQVIEKREQNPNYELSEESLNDNLQISEIEHKAAKQLNYILKKTDNKNYRKILEDMKFCIDDITINDVKQTFISLNKICKFEYNYLYDDILYHDKNINLIREAIVFEKEQKILPELNFFLMRNTLDDDSIIFPPVFEETETNIDINLNESDAPKYNFPDVDSNVDLDINELTLHLPDDN